MDIQKEMKLLEDILLSNPEFDKSLLVKDEDGDYEDCEISDLLGIFQAGIEVAEREARKTQIREWLDYTETSPRRDGRYQIFISGEQLTAEYKHPFGFACPQDGCAFIQELISHWALLPEPPKAQEQSHD